MVRGYIELSSPSLPGILHAFLLFSHLKPSGSKLKMRFSSVVLAVFALVSTGLADKTCTPSFDYCSDILIQSKGKSARCA